MNKVYPLFTFLLALKFLCFSQNKGVIVKFVPTYGTSAVVQGKKYFSVTNNDSLRIETLRFYVSNITLLKYGKVVYNSKTNFYLIDLEKKLQIALKTKNSAFDAIKFNVGIDSLTNVSGAMGGDLDPVNGMYWAWQSGYINFKLEGTSKICSTRNNAFQFHIGGYMHPNATIQTINLPVKNNSAIEINIALDKFLNGVDLKTTNEIMSPGQHAVKLAKLYQTIFWVTE